MNNNKKIKIKKKNQSEIKNTITEMKNRLDGITSRINEAEDQVSDLEHKVVGDIQLEQQKRKKNLNNEGSLRDIWDNIKHNNIFIIVVV